MKIISVILSFYVLLLAAQPCCTGNNCGEDEAEAETEQLSDTAPFQEEDGCMDCSPFFSCGACVGFTFSTTTFSLATLVDIDTNQPFPIVPSFFSEFHHTIWQPPKHS